MSLTAKAVPGPVSAPVLNMPGKDPAEVIQSVWATLHRAGRSDELSRAARDRVHQAIGRYEFVWCMLGQTYQVRFKNKEQAVETLRAHMQTVDQKRALGRQMALLIPFLYSRRDACVREAAKVDPKNRRSYNRHRAGVSVLEQAFWRLLSLPLISQSSPHVRTRAIDAALWWDLSKKLSTGSGEVLHISTSSAELKDAAREVSAAFEDLRRSMGRQKENVPQAPFLAVLGAALERLARVRGRLWYIGENSADDAVKAQALSLREAVELQVYAIMETATFSQLS